MSFILEAQQRDDADIDPGAAAQLAMDEHQRSRWRWALWLIGLALIANVAILGYLFGPWHSDQAAGGNNGQVLSNPATSRELVVKPRERTGPTTRPVRPTQAPARRATVASNPTQQPAQAAATPSPPPAATGKGRVLTPEQAASLNIGLPETEAPAPTVAEAATKVANSADTGATKVATKGPIPLSELAPEDRKDFPELEFSTHIFADDPALRAVVVNSKRLSEGESIGEMVLRAVTEDGIIVDYRGQRVAVSVMDTWN